MSKDLQKQCQDARVKKELLETNLQIKQLERAQQILENTYTHPEAFTSIFADRLDRFGPEPDIFYPTGQYDRRYGRNIPIYTVEQELNLYRAASRVLCATNTYAIGYLQGLTSYVIGEGFDYQVEPIMEGINVSPKLLRAVQNVIDDHMSRNFWHGGEQPSIEVETFERSLEDGEFFIAHFPDEDGYTDVRIIEPEHVVQPPGTNFEEWGFGVQTEKFDPQKPLGYWVMVGYSSADGMEFEPEDIIHFKSNAKRGMKRGIPDFTYDTRESFDKAGKLRRNMAIGAAIQAAIVAIREHEGATGSEVQSFVDAISDWERYNATTGNRDKMTDYQPGTFLDVGKHMKYHPPPAAANAQANVTILQAVLRSAGVRWNAPEWLVTGDSSNNNFSSSLTAESQFVRTINRKRKQYKEAYRRSMWAAVRNWCEVRGHIAGHRFADIKRLCRIAVSAPLVENQNKEADARIDDMLIRLGVKDRETAATERGYDWERVKRNNEEYDRKQQQMEQEIQAQQQQAQMQGMQQMGGGPEQPGQEQGEQDPVEDLFGPIDGLSEGEQEEKPVTESVMEARLLEYGFTGVIRDSAGRQVAFMNGKRVAMNRFQGKKGRPDKEYQASKTPGVRQTKDTERWASQMQKAISGIADSREKKYSLVQDAANAVQKFLERARKTPRKASEAAQSPKQSRKLLKIAALGAEALIKTLTISMMVEKRNTSLLGASMKTLWRTGIMHSAVKAMLGSSDWSRNDSRELARAMYDIRSTGQSDWLLPSGMILPLLLKSDDVREYLPDELARPSDDPISKIAGLVDSFAKVPDNVLKEIEESFGSTTTNFSNINQQRYN